MSRPRLTAATTALAIVASTLTLTAAATVSSTAANAADLSGPWTPVVDTSALNNKVYSMLQNGNTVYVGGMFTSAGDTAAASYVASFDATNSSANWQAVTNTALATGSGYTYLSSMALSGTDLYIGGRFAQGTLNNVAKVTLGNGAVTGLDGGTVAYNVSGNTERDVEEIAVIGNKVYVGGGFAGVSNGSGTVADTAGIAAWDATTTNWSALDNGFDYDANTAPNTNGMVAVGNDLYIGGQFLGGKDGGTTITSKRVIAWSDATSTWSSMNGGFGQGLVASMANSTSGHVQGLFAAGNFTSDATQTVTFNGLAKWDSGTSAWATISSPSGVSGGSAVIEAMAFDAAGDLYIGGNFTSAGGVAANNIAKWDGTSWSALTCGPNNGVNNTVRAILPQTDGSLIVGGFFTSAGGDPLNQYVARYTPGAAANCPYPATGGGGGGPAAGTPSAPQNVSASYNAELQKLTVTWTPPATDNGSGIVQYLASTADGRVRCFAAPSANSCSMSVSDVPIPFRKPYNDRNASQPESDWVLYNTTQQAADYLRLSAENGDQAAVSWANGVYAQARNSVGWGALGFAVAQPKRPPGAPTDVVATGKYKAVTVSYKAPADLGNPSGVAAYLVQADTGQACIARATSANPLECTYTDLTPGTKYTFKVQALGGAGWGNFSSASNSASPYNLLLDSVSRPEVKILFIKRGSKLEAEGRTPGLAKGTVLTPVMQVGADGAFVPLTKDTTKVDGDGNFSWSRKLDKKDNGKPVSLYFTYGNDKTETLTVKLGATVGLPSAPRDVKVKSDTSGITVSWQPPARNGGSPITEYVMTSDLRAPSWATSKFVTCYTKATSCTMPGSTRVFDPKKEYTFSVVAVTERGTSPKATKKWKGELYRLNIFKRTRIDSEILLSFSAFGWPSDARGFEIQAKVGENGTWKKQGTASLDPDYVEPIGDWAGMLPKSVTGGSEVFYRVKSDKGYSNVVRFRLQSSFEYSFG